MNQTSYSDLDEVFALWASHEDFEPDDAQVLEQVSQLEEEF